jgi:predicted DNA-binding transcriptional regulator YafY
LWIGYVDADGGTTHRMIEPVAMSSGAIVAYDRLRGAVRTFVLHRITGVRPVSEDELESAPAPATAADAAQTDTAPTDTVPTTAVPTTAVPTTAVPTTAVPTTAVPTDADGSD